MGNLSKQSRNEQNDRVLIRLETSNGEDPDEVRGNEVIYMFVSIN